MTLRRKDTSLRIIIAALPAALTAACMLQTERAEFVVDPVTPFDGKVYVARLGDYGRLQKTEMLGGMYVRQGDAYKPDSLTAEFRRNRSFSAADAGFVDETWYLYQIDNDLQNYVLERRFEYVGRPLDDKSFQLQEAIDENDTLMGWAYHYAYIKGSCLSIFDLDFETDEVIEFFQNPRDGSEIVSLFMQRNAELLQIVRRSYELGQNPRFVYAPDALQYAEFALYDMENADDRKALRDALASYASKNTTHDSGLEWLRAHSDRCNKR